MRYDVSTINRYAKGLSNTETEACERTIRRLKNILLNGKFEISNENYEDSDEGLNYGFSVKDEDGNGFTFLVQGSYANNTCVRQESDVDIALICETTFHGTYPFPKTAKDYGFVDSPFDVLVFKEKLAELLRNNGLKAVCHKKCIDVKGTGENYKEFDLVPCLRYRDYASISSLDPDQFVPGTWLTANNGACFINYPEQSIMENRRKNMNTHYLYKKVVRILKHIRSDMEEKGIPEAKLVSSFELECLVSNVPDGYFLSPSGDDSEGKTSRAFEQVVNYLYCCSSCIGSWKETNQKQNIYGTSAGRLAQNGEAFIKKLYMFIQ